MEGRKLTGLEGTNPLGFLAGLGVQLLFESDLQPSRLWWTDEVIPCAVIDSEVDVETLLQRAVATFKDWAECDALNPELPKGASLKFTPENLRSYLERTRQDKSGNTIATALVAEGSIDNNKRAKPSDLYFTAGQQLFLKMAKEILRATTKDHLREGLLGPWSYNSKLPSLMWDVVDDRIYALSSFDPAGEKKLTNPGAEALAILGLSRHPVFAGYEMSTGRGKQGRTLTRGCSGSWKQGYYTWPLWSRPASPKAVDAMLTHATASTGRAMRERSRWYRSWGIMQVMRSAIRRSSQGGYGTFGPPEIIWP